MTESLEKCDDPSAPASRARGEPKSSGGSSSTTCSLATCFRPPPTSKRGPKTPLRTATCGTGPGTTRPVSLSSLVTTERELPAPPTADGIARLRRRQFVLFATTHDVEHSGAAALHSVIEHWGR